MNSNAAGTAEDGEGVRRSPLPMQVAIDGPAGAGKSTVAKGVAKALGFIYVDTGAMYRAVALKVLRLSGPDAEPDWGETAEGACLEFRPTPKGQHIFMDGEDVETAIRDPKVSDWSSRVSANPRVRRALTAQMQRMGRSVSVVMEGRDVGTVVMPEARLKVFLTAAPEERARRRTMELAAKGQIVSEEKVLAEIRERDHRDATRADAPLVKAADAVEVDTSGISPNEVIRRIVALAGTR